MKIHLGSGWNITHMTDRVIHLEKDSTIYRRFTDRDGFVRVRIEPQMTRDQALQLALTEAMKQDDLLAQRVAKQLMPSAAALLKYRQKQAQLAQMYGVPTEENKVYRP